MGGEGDVIRHGARERAELAVARDGGAYSEARELGRDVLSALAALAALEQDAADYLAACQAYGREREEQRERAEAAEADAATLRKAAESFLSHGGWYRRCLEDMQDGKAVRGLAEAKAGHDRAEDALGAALAAGAGEETPA